MPSYRFKFYDPNSRSEKLGAAVLADDDEALSFAKRVVRELIHSDEKLYATWKVELTARAFAGGFESGRIHKALGMSECVGIDSPLEGRGNAEVVF